MAPRGPSTALAWDNMLTNAVTVDVFANGVSGPGAIDTRVHVGAALRVSY